MKFFKIQPMDRIDAMRFIGDSEPAVATAKLQFQFSNLHDCWQIFYFCTLFAARCSAIRASCFGCGGMAAQVSSGVAAAAL
jgi:hypothetical protein